MNKELLSIKSVTATIDNHAVLNGVTLNIRAGEIHAIMGPNGSGKSTLAKVIMGHPSYEITGGEIRFERQNLKNLATNERAKRGIFLAFQNPKEIEGIALRTMLRSVQKNMTEKGKEKLPSVIEFNKNLKEQIRELKLSDTFLERSINTGFSGGEKKKGEILQMKVMNPKLIILDEIDSGLDVDALKIVANAVKKQHTKNTAVLIITHYQRILEHIHPDKVHVMVRGKIARSGGKTFAKELEEKGYTPFEKQIEPTVLNVLQ